LKHSQNSKQLETKILELQFANEIQQGQRQYCVDIQKQITSSSV